MGRSRHVGGGREKAQYGVSPGACRVNPARVDQTQATGTGALPENPGAGFSANVVVVPLPSSVLRVATKFGQERDQPA